MYRKEVNCKIVYYGPGMSGKTTNLEYVHETDKVKKENKSELTSLATDQDRTLFFDFMSLDFGKIKGTDIVLKFRLFTVPGQVFYNSTRRVVLQGVDGVIFVVDSQKEKLDENCDSFCNLIENLQSLGLSISDIPVVFQYNKRDLPNILDINFLETVVNVLHLPYFEGIATTGHGVLPTLKECVTQVLDRMSDKMKEVTGRYRSKLKEQEKKRKRPETAKIVGALEESLKSGRLQQPVKLRKQDSRRIDVSGVREIMKKGDGEFAAGRDQYYKGCVPNKDLLEKEED